MDAMTKPKRKLSPAPSRAYPDLHDHVRALDEAGLLITVDRPINKDTEMHPLVRWQFRGGIAEKDRKAFLFTNVIDSKGRKYDIPVLVGGLAANRDVYRVGFGKPLEEIGERWVRAIAQSDPAAACGARPCHEIVIIGKALDKPGQRSRRHSGADLDAGLGQSRPTPPSQYITKDPDTGVQNIGNYRGQMKARGGWA